MEKRFTEKIGRGTIIEYKLKKLKISFSKVHAKHLLTYQISGQQASHRPVPG